MDLDLVGKRALVTGSTSGIGNAIAMTLAQEGATVVIHGRNADRAQAAVDAIRRSGGAALFVLADLESANGCKMLAEEVDSRLGGLDILVNNAGGATDPAHTWANTCWDTWLADYETNIGSSFRMIQHVLPGMQERGWGRIILISSTAATMPASNTDPGYSSAKAAILNMTVSLSRTFSGDGITVNCVTPGVIETPFYRSYFSSNPTFANKSHTEVDEIVARQWGIPTGHIGVPEDISPAVAFLCSAQADWITGISLRVDGGMSININV